MLPEHIEQLRRFVGPELDSLLESREASERRLADPNPTVRFGAVILLTHFWEITDFFRSHCEQIALADANLRVRSSATGSLGFCFRNTGNRRVEKFLAKTVRDESVERRIRKTAYSALLSVNPSTCHNPLPADVVLNDDFPNYVDWAFVDRLI